MPVNPLDWANYRQQASQATQGINSMPHTFAGYASMAGATPQQAKEMLYPGAKPGAAGGVFDPQTFNGAAYLAANPDVAADPYYGRNPLEHYQKLGQREGRQLTPASSAPVVAPAGLAEMLGIAPSPSPEEQPTNPLFANNWGP